MFHFLCVGDCVAVLGEMWHGVCLAVVMELSPRHMHTTSTAIYLFIMVNIGPLPPLPFLHASV